MRELVGGKNTIGRTAAVLKKPIKRPLPFTVIVVGDSHKYFGSSKETLRFPEIKSPAFNLS